MKINEIIREKRKALSLTQEQIADFLGVSTPAVSKWEKGAAYPDITLLPALARLLKTDLNTLLSFQEDLTDIEIENFVNELDKTVQEQGYEAAFQKALDKIREYPTCDRLIYSAILYLEGALALYNVSSGERYQEVYETFYRRLAASEIPEIRDTATSMLISYARNRGDFAKAEELINALPFSAIDKDSISEVYAILNGEITLPFTDVPEDRWSYKYIKNMYFNGIMNGTSETTFEPEKPLTREEAATMFYRLMKNIDNRFSVLNKVLNEKMDSDNYYK